MEVRVLDVVGAPDDAVISVRNGRSRRQASAPAALEHIKSKGSFFSFMVEPGTESQVKVDVLKPLAGKRLLVRPGPAEYTFPLGGGVTDSNTGMSPAVPSITMAVREVTDPKLAAESPTMNSEDGLGQLMRAILDEIIRERPEEPYSYIADKLAATLAAERADNSALKAACTRNQRTSTLVLSTADGDSLPEALDEAIAPAVRAAMQQDLAKAAADGDAATIQQLLHAHADPNRSAWSGGDASAVELGDATAGLNPLCIAVRHNHQEAARTLLEAGADPCGTSVLRRDRDRDVRCTPLSLAAQAGNSELVERLLRAKADVHQEVASTKGFTALHYAAAAGQLQCVEAMLQTRCSPDLLGAGQLGRPSPADLARTNGFAAVAALLQQGASASHTSGPAVDAEEAIESTEIQELREALRAATAVADAAKTEAASLRLVLAQQQARLERLEQAVGLPKATLQTSQGKGGEASSAFTTTAGSWPVPADTSMTQDQGLDATMWSVLEATMSPRQGAPSTVVTIERGSREYGGEEDPSDVAEEVADEIAAQVAVKMFTHFDLDSPRA
mmetsp:Transcript_19000/g.34307  ORF Transcript_19000/g.34307 Transcript_19000/m.34307 type:complete len:561 (+) Transcript_19000:76-1758(+)